MRLLPVKIAGVGLSTLFRRLIIQRRNVGWIIAGGTATTLVLLSCTSFESSHAIMAPPSIAGAEFVGSEECATCHEALVKGFATATHSRLQANGGNAKAMGCESCHGPGSLHVQGGGDRTKIVNPRKSPATCFQCHTNVRAAFELPHHHPVLEGKVGCADCHNPHKGDAIKGGGTSLP